MAKKDYNVAERFQEVARRQKEMDEKYGKKKKEPPIAPKRQERPIVYEGAGMRKAHPKDVNLPYEDPKKKKSIGPSYAR